MLLRYNGRTCYPASIPKRSASPSKRRRADMSLGRKWHARAAACWRGSQALVLTGQQGTRDTAAWSHSQWETSKKKKQTMWNVSGRPLARSSTALSLQNAWYSWRRKVNSHSHAERNKKISNDLKSDNILAFQMSLLIFPPFRTAKSLHGCF